MTKRALEHAIEDIGEEVLTALASTERIQWMLEAHTQNKEYWFNRLIETCPSEQAPIIAAGNQTLLVWAHDVAYDLHTIALWIKLLQREQHAVMVIDSYRGEAASDERLDRAADRAEDIRAQFTNLYVTYHSHRRFATDELGVDLETWLSLHKNGPAVLAFAETVLDNRTQRELAARWLAEDDKPIDNPNAVFKPYVEQRYEALVTTWDELVATTGRGRHR